MSIRWDDDLSKALARISSKARVLDDDVAHGAKVILEDAKDRAPLAPKKDGDHHPHLKTTGKINRTPAKGTVSITFSGPYAAYIHEHLWFKHPHGGEAKFLEVALLHKGREAIKEAAQHFWRRAT